MSARLGHPYRLTETEVEARHATAERRRAKRLAPGPRLLDSEGKRCRTILVTYERGPDGDLRRVTR